MSNIGLKKMVIDSYDTQKQMIQPPAFNRNEREIKTLCDMKKWLNEECIKSHICVKRISFNESQEWQWDERGFLAHLTTRFFSVVGVRYFSVPDGQGFTQPFIYQSEIGLLSFLVFKQCEEWWVLAHAKVEPGNINGAQLAPTVQATKSNYEAAHGGNETHYLGMVQSAEHLLYNQLQSEQNSRFLAKRNRNSAVLVAEKLDEKDSKFKWIRINELLPMLGESNIVNTDARSVLVCWLFTDVSALRECLDSESVFAEILIKSIESRIAVNQKERIEKWLDVLNNKWSTETEVISLKDIGSPWLCNGLGITSSEDISLMIYQIKVSCSGREVPVWDQPVAGSGTPSCIVLFMGLFKGTLHMLVQARLEAGNRKGFELTTTVQSESSAVSCYEKKYIQMSKKSGKILLDFHNSEEGGRFDRCISEYRIVWVGEVTQEQEGPFHRWISLSQFSVFLSMENRITNELRSAASSLLSIKNI
jgi:oxidase EvaA